MLSFQYFIDEFLISLDDNDDDYDVDYEEITSRLIHNLSIVFHSKLEQSRYTLKTSGLSRITWSNIYLETPHTK